MKQDVREDVGFQTATLEFSLVDFSLVVTLKTRGESTHLRWQLQAAEPGCAAPPRWSRTDPCSLQAPPGLGTGLEEQVGFEMFTVPPSPSHLPPDIWLSMLE